VALQSWPVNKNLAARGTIKVGEVVGKQVRAERVNAAEAQVAEPAREERDLMALTDVVAELGEGGESEVTEFTGEFAPLRGQFHVRQFLIQRDLFHMGRPLMPH